MPDTRNAKDCLELSPTNFSIFTLKNVTWQTYLISFPVQYCFLFRFVCIMLFSLIWFLQIWVANYLCLRYYDQLVHFDKEIHANISGSILNVSTLHLNGIWHLICRYLLKPVLGRHPVLKGHYSFPEGVHLRFHCILQIIYWYFYHISSPTGSGWRWTRWWWKHVYQTREGEKKNTRLWYFVNCVAIKCREDHCS